MSTLALTAAPTGWDNWQPRGRWREAELAVDLGDAIGGARWWRGLASLALLSWALVYLGATQTPLPGPTTPAAAPSAALVLAPLALGAAGAARAAPTRLAVRLAEPPERPRIEVVGRVAGGGLARGLEAGGVGRAEAAAIAALVAPEVDPGAIKPGTRLDLVLGRRETKAVPRPLEALAFRAAFDLKLAVARGEGGALILTRIPVAIDRTPLSLSAPVGRSLARAAREAGVPATVAAQAARLFGHRVDLERGVGRSDRFTIVIEHQRAETGETIAGGLLYARLERAKGENIELMRWAGGGGREPFFLADGSSVKKGLMATPIAGARMTSGFGLRLHPILGYSRFHRGVDFGAGHGAPILAAAAGRVEYAGWHGGHGKYVRLGHGRGLQTAYGHMSRIAAKPGQMVAQGQVIGWVGSTGISTGPHLHYEVWQGGKAVDPRGAKFVSGPVLAGGELARFRAEMGRLKGLRRGMAAVEGAIGG